MQQYEFWYRTALYQLQRPGTLLFNAGCNKCFPLNPEKEFGADRLVIFEKKRTL